MAFDNLTLVPIQTKMIEASLLTAAEEAWLDDYHKQVGSWPGAQAGRRACTMSLRLLFM